MTSLSTLFRLNPAVVGASQRSFSYPTIWSDPSVVSGVRQIGSKDKRNHISIPCSRCNAISKSHVQDVLKSSIPEFKWQKMIENANTKGDALQVLELNNVREYVDTIKAMFGSMGDGEISTSAYDTAWVALVQDINGSGAPQFPSSLQWIIENQLSDGSWGDKFIYSAHDRIISTLASVIALKSWNIHSEMCEKGIFFIQRNMCKLKDEKIEHMPIGFEVAFPSLVEIARSLELEVIEDSPILQEIYAKRDLKVKRIPKDMMHVVPTSLLHSLEGMHGLNWEKLLKLQSSNGSFLFSPSSTAFALMQTKDENCLKYIEKVVERFNGGVPNVYPVDMFEHVWVIDRLERLGISRYFQPEIKKCIDYIHRYWTEEGISWARNSTVHDIDDTAMGFRILRLHGRDVSPDAFQHFKKGPGFFCFNGQSTQAVTGIFNLYRASQVSFPGEGILDEAKRFAIKFLKEKQDSKQLIDKWIITKDLPGEVEYVLGVPWYASLPRVEASFFIQQYGGENDVWIGKTLYRMPYVNNNVYLELSKLDFNSCQMLHRLEWVNMQKWYAESNLQEHGISKKMLLTAYFLAASSVFEPEKSMQRLAWTQSTILAKAISSHFENEGQIMAFKQGFINNTSTAQNRIDNNSRWSSRSMAGKRLLQVLNEALETISLGTQGRDIYHALRQSWESWLLSWQQQDKQHQVGDAELLVRTITLCSGTCLMEDRLFTHPQYKHLVTLTNTLCHKLQNSKVKKRGINGASTNGTTISSVDSDMQELVQRVLRNSDDLEREIKQIFLIIAKSFYYEAHCPRATIDLHIQKVLFEEVL